LLPFIVSVVLGCLTLFSATHKKASSHSLFFFFV